MKYRWLFGVAAIGIVAVMIVLFITGGRGKGPKEAARLHEKAQSLQREGKTDDAIMLYRAAIANDPESFPINRDYQNLMRHAGKLDEVRAEYRKRAANMPKSAGAQYLAARLEDGDALEKGMLRALELNPDFEWPHRALAQYYMECRRVDDAIRQHEHVVASPKGVLDDARILIAYIYVNGRYDEIDRVISGWWAKRPSFARQGEWAILFRLGPLSNGMTALLQAGLDLRYPELFQIVISRDSDTMKRLITVKKAGDRFVVSWTPRWLKPEEAPEDNETDLWDREQRPTFAEVHAEALNRLKNDDEQAPEK